MQITIFAEGNEALQVIGLLAGSNLGFALNGVPSKAAQPSTAEIIAAAVVPEPAKEETAAAKKKREKAEKAEAAAAVAAVVETPAKAPEVAPAAAAAEPGGVSIDMLRDSVIAFTKAAGPKAAVALVLEQTGADKVSKVAAADYPKLYKALQDALEAAAVAA